MAYVKSAPASAIEMFEKRIWNEPQDPEQVAAFARALVVDPRMDAVWSKLEAVFHSDDWFSSKFRDDGWGQVFFWSAVFRFKQSINPEPWDRLTRAEQLQWLKRLSELTNDLVMHLEQAPIQPGHLSHFVPDAVLRQALLDNEELNFPGICGWAVRWGLADSLRYYTKRHEGDELADQWMKRPRHAKSARERYVYQLSADCRQYFGQPMQDIVAITTGLAFNDDAIGERLVRRITNENLHRQDFSEES